jgi:hypothetical protein
MPQAGLPGSPSLAAWQRPSPCRSAVPGPLTLSIPASLAARGGEVAEGVASVSAVCPEGAPSHWEHEAAPNDCSADGSEGVMAPDGCALGFAAGPGRVAASCSTCTISAAVGRAAGSWERQRCCRSATSGGHCSGARTGAMNPRNGCSPAPGRPPGKGAPVFPRHGRFLSPFEPACEAQDVNTLLQARPPALLPTCCCCRRCSCRGGGSARQPPRHATVNVHARALPRTCDQFPKQYAHAVNVSRPACTAA